MRSHEHFIKQLSMETIGAQRTMHHQLAQFVEVGLQAEDIRSDELAYFALSLAIYSIFQWSRSHEKNGLADGVCLTVLKTAVNRRGVRTPIGTTTP